MLTKLPSCLNKCNSWIMHKIRDGPYEEVRFRLEIRIKHGDKVTLLNIVIQHPLLQCTSIVPFPIVPHLILHVFTFVSPKLALKLHQILLRTHNISDIVLRTAAPAKFSNASAR